MFRLLFRLLFRLWFMLLLFFLGRLFGSGAGRGRFSAHGEDVGPGGSLDSMPGARPPRRAPGTIPPIDRSDAVDVPFTEIPPAHDPARPAAGGS